MAKVKSAPRASALGGGAKSRALFARASKVLVGGVNSPVRSFNSVGGTPVFISAGKGARLRDADGKTYIDYCASWGPLILGHAQPAVLAAAARAARQGTTFGAPTELEVLLAEQVRAAFPLMQLMRFTSSGTEAVMGALRAARAFTRRDMVVKFAGCYHGHADSLLVAAGSGAMTLGQPDSAGVPAAWANTTISLPYNDRRALVEAFQKWGDRIAAVIVEPIVGNMGVVLPEKGFLEHLRKITQANAALLVFDEVITGFRLGYGGAQSVLEIEPDLTTLGKIVGGGFPLGIYGGRREVLEQVAPLGPVYQAGTLSGNPVAVAAGLQTLRMLKRSNPYPALEKLTKRLVQGIRTIATEAGVPVQVNSVASLFTVFFTDHPVINLTTAKTSDTGKYRRFFHALLKGGVYFPPAQFEAAFVSGAHKAGDIDKTLTACRKAIKTLN